MTFIEGRYNAENVQKFHNHSYPTGYCDEYLFFFFLPIISFGEKMQQGKRLLSKLSPVNFYEKSQIFIKNKIKHF